MLYLLYLRKSIFCFLILLSFSTQADSILELSKEIVEKREKLAKVWPGFWPENQPFSIYDSSGKVLLVTKNNIPSGFSPINDKVNYLYQGSVEYFKKSGPFESNFDFGAISAPSVKSENDSFDANLLFHEAFHYYQFKEFKNKRERYSTQDDITSEMLALKFIENQLLKNALLANDLQEQDKILELYTALRKRRQLKEPESLTVAQLASERIEGVANYVGYKLLSELKNRDDKWVALKVAEFLNSKDRISSVTDEYINWNSYGVGGALTFLLLKRNPMAYKAIDESVSPFEMISGRFTTVLSDEKYDKFI